MPLALPTNLVRHSKHYGLVHGWAHIATWGCLHMPLSLHVCMNTFIAQMKDVKNKHRRVSLSPLCACRS